MEKNRKLIWDEQALIKLEKSLEWISETSIQQAEQVEQTILETIEIIRVHPERNPPNKYKQNNSGNYRAFETHKLPDILYPHRRRDQDTALPTCEAEFKKVLRQKPSQAPASTRGLIHTT